MLKACVYGLIFILIFSDWDNLIGKEDSFVETPQMSNLVRYQLPERLDFCGEPIPLHDAITRERAEREFFINLQSPGQIILYIKRSGRFFPIFDSIFKKYNIPDDIKYLAVAESGLQIAMSPKSAYGIWQFIPSTAKDYGLQVDDYIDERLNIYKATHAACKYLKRAYEVFGSWTLAAAAYNMGFSNLSDNIDFQNNKNFYQLFLNEETSRYIFRIAIIKEILVNHRKYGFEIPKNEIYQPFKVKQVVWDGEIQNLAEWAKAQGTSYFWVKTLNPWILKRSLPKPKQPYVIDIPLESK
ncbi:MAG: lytic transglycosylase domain-containing protein [Ignavibacteria bacterium]|nr:lytic transglycosylase domain-containing protein [Ignavibacteria bacterium]